MFANLSASAFVVRACGCFRDGCGVFALKNVLDLAPFLCAAANCVHTVGRSAVRLLMVLL